MSKFALITLLFLPIAQFCYGSPGLPGDSVKVPIENIYASNAIADSLDECKELKDSLLSAVEIAKDGIVERDSAISGLIDENANWAKMDQNSLKIIKQKDAEIKKKGVAGWKKLALGVLIGFAGHAALQ